VELIGEALYEPALETFPFIRFTNWKQAGGSAQSTPSENGNGFHSYASRIGSKPEMAPLARCDIPYIVSIHTLHELEARS